jgi:membrane-associated phospholipid phosphatase
MDFERAYYICPHMKTISRIISYLFHPLLFPSYGTLLILGLNPNMFGYFGERLHFVWLIIVFALTFIFPAVWMLMMKGLGMIDSLHMETSRERIVPFVAGITFYLWTTWMFKANVHMKIPANQLIFYMMLGACISVSIAFFMNIFTMVSLHTIGAGSVLGLVLILVRFSTFDLRLLFVAAIILAGIIGTARLILKAHTELEVISGYFIGFAGQFLAFSVISKFL